MTSYEEVNEKFLSELVGYELHTEEGKAAIQSYRSFTATRPPEPTPEPPAPIVVKESWFDKHSDALIKAAGAIVGVALVVGGEKLGEHIYNTKALQFVPKS